MPTVYNVSVWLTKRMTAARCNVPRSDTEKQLAAFLSDSNDSMQIVGTTAAETRFAIFSEQRGCKLG